MTSCRGVGYCPKGKEVIRRLTGSDWKYFRQIRLEALREEPAAFAASAEDFETLSEAQLKEMLANKMTFVAFSDSEPIGIMSIVPQQLKKRRHRGTLIFVYLRASFRNRGLSRALHAALTDCARAAGIWQIELQVNAENREAIEFYERQGYNKIGKIVGGLVHEGREIDEIIMTMRT